MRIKEAVEKNFRESLNFLKKTISLPSVTGEGKGEEDVQNFIRDRFASFGDAQLVSLPKDIKKDPEYTFAEKDLNYSRRKNLVLEYPSSGGGRSLILNSHSDVVPAKQWAEAFSPVEKDNTIYGRGACDAKGQVAAIYLTLLTLKELGVKLKGKLLAEVVIEEEVGGNGALAIIRQGYKADGAIVMEASQLKIYPANRGAVWFRLDVEGKSVHMGRITEGVSAIEKTCLLVQKMKEYERRLIEESKNVPLFEKFKQPVQVNFGTIRGGSWPSMVCGDVSLEGGVGFLPNKDINMVKRELTDTIENCGDDWITSHYKLSFPKLHNDAYAIDVNHPLVEAMKKAEADSDVTPEIEGFIASCDARLFNKVGKMPVVVFGPGNLEYAHSDNEQIDTQQIKTAAEILVRTVLNWCGTEEKNG
jgi:acetylornithine deacetylase